MQQRAEGAGSLEGIELGQVSKAFNACESAKLGGIGTVSVGHAAVEVIPPVFNVLQQLLHVKSNVKSYSEMFGEPHVLRSMSAFVRASTIQDMTR